MGKVSGSAIAVVWAAGLPPRGLLQGEEGVNVAGEWGKGLAEPLWVLTDLEPEHGEDGWAGADGLQHRSADW